MSDLKQPGEPAAGPAIYQRGMLIGLSRNALLLGWVSFLTDLASEMVYPIIPLFITSVLGASVLTLGVIEGVAEGIASLMKAASGWMSDRFQRRSPFIAAGYGLSAVGKIVLASATIWPTALASRTLDRFGKGLRGSPRDALLAESVAPEYRGKAFGIHRGMDTMGAVGGPLLALLVLSQAHPDLRRVLWWAVIPAIASVVLAFVVRDIKRPRSGKAAQVKHPPLSPTLKHYLVGWGVFACANSSDAFLLLRTKEMGYAIQGTILLYTVYNVVYALASPFLGRLSDTIGRKVLLLAGLVVFAIVYACIGLAQAPWHLWILFAIYGLYIAATDGIGKALAVDLAAPEARATAVGWLGMVSGFGAVIAGVLGGLLWKYVGSWATFLLGTVGALAALAILAGLRTVRRQAAG